MSAKTLRRRRQRIAARRHVRERDLQVQLERKLTNERLFAEWQTRNPQKSGESHLNYLLRYNTDRLFDQLCESNQLFARKVGLT